VRQARSLGPVKIALFRFAIGLGLVGGAAVMGRVKLRFNDKRLLFLRGFTGGISVFIAFVAITKLGLAKGTILIYSFPIFGCFFSAVFLKERLRLVHIASIAIAFAGIYLISCDDGNSMGPFSVFGKYELLTIVGAVFGGIAITLIRKLHDTDDSASIYFSQCAVGMMLVALPAIKGGIGVELPGLILLAGVGVFATLGQLLMTEGYRYVPVRTGSLLSMLDPVLAYVAGILIFGEACSGRSVIGAALVVTACASVVVLGRQDGPMADELVDM
jgi:drug/metabolite transporter (DMT)-like permease